MVGPYLLLLAAVGAERLYELRVSRRNATAAFARGAVEYGREHFVWMRALHATFLLACALEVLLCGRPFRPWLAAACLGVALAAQALRYWAVRSLGPRWNVRVIVEPGLPAEVRGPYRYVRHPNYVAVALEGVALPMMHGAWLTAAVFTIANAVLLGVRIRCEERALRIHCEYEPRLGARARFVPLPSTTHAP